MQNKKIKWLRFGAAGFVLLITAVFALSAASYSSISLEHIGNYETGVFDESAAEIVAFDPGTQRLVFVNANDATLEVLDISDPTNPTELFSVDMTVYGAEANSVAVYDGVMAVAVESDPAQDPGSVVFLDMDGNFINAVMVGALPDMVTFTPNGKFLLVANEGEPNDDYDVDPEGSVSVINLRPSVAEIDQSDVRTASFDRFNMNNLPEGVRVFGPGATVAQDLEPEYIAVSPDSRYAFVSLQENNGMAIVNIKNARVMRLVPFGTKDHMMAGNGMDVSNRDDMINITNWPVHGMYQPDTIVAYRDGRRTFIVTANEGDARDYDGFSEEDRVKDLDLDPTAFPNAAELQEDENLGRLLTTTTLGDTDGDGDFDKIYAYGARSFSIWTPQGRQLFDSGDQFEQITAQLIPDDFNSTNDENDSFDNRSDDKGPEPEGLAVGKVNGRTYAFIGLERVGGIMVYDISNPRKPMFIEYVTTRDFSGDAEAGTAGNLAPEGLTFVSAEDSPNGTPLLLVGYEVSGSVAIFQINTD